MKLGFRSSLVLAIGILAAAFYFLGVRPRLQARTELNARARAMRHPAVNVVLAQRAAHTNELLLPASLQALVEVPLYARTNGYLARLLADLGDRVKAGQTLAVIEGPELVQELNQARATLEQVRAHLALARSSAARWQDLGRQNAVAQQEVDEKQAALAAREADVHAAEANVSRLTELVQYQTIVTPIDGVISARNIDIGALVSSGAAGRELFRITQTDTLRVFVNVPQTYVRSVQPGQTAEVMVNEYPSRVFTGKVVRVAGALDATSRTLLTEVQLPNEKGELLAGMFGQVRFRLPASEPPLQVPSNAAVIRGDGTFVVSVSADNKIHYLKVKLGRDFGTQFEILSGLAVGTRVVANPNDALTEGLTVEPILPTPGKKN
ncbi:MAG: efflux RND transporter periplasmic adaptor subunit [Opitutaceae bacterium]|nr:efflux RND transporter periplasmic adaptor subunit [Opitutaceae bacterium]